MSDLTRILIADDDPAVRRTVRLALERSRRLLVVAEAGDGLRAWERLAELRPHIAILDIGMPGMDGMTLAREIRRAGLPVDVIFLTVCNEKPMFDAALELGMKGYLLKHCTGDEILKCVKAVAAGEHCASPPVVSHMIRERQRLRQQPPGGGTMDDLTFQERAILRRVRQHKSSKEIASEMGISVRTIDTHRSSICKKLGIHGNYGLNRYADGGSGKEVMRV